jgi:hypothetical protein
MVWIVQKTHKGEKMFRKIFGAIAALMLVATTSQAQYTANFTPGTVNGTTNSVYGGVYVGGYNGGLSGGNLPGVIAADATLANAFWCLDFNGTFGAGTPVTVTSFAQLIALNSGLTSQLTNIAKAVQYGGLGTTPQSEDAAIHKFVWSQFSGVPVNATWNALTTPTGIVSQNVNLSEFFLVDFDGITNGPFTLGGKQELAFRSVQGGNLETNVVPEPSTYLLMASGLAGLAFIRRRKTVTA